MMDYELFLRFKEELDEAILKRYRELDEIKDIINKSQSEFYCDIDSIYKKGVRHLTNIEGCDYKCFKVDYVQEELDAADLCIDICNGILIKLS